MGVNSYEDGTKGPISEEAQRIHNRGAVGLFMLFIGVYLVGFGSTMTGLAYGYEPREGYTSLAETYNLRTDIAGPVLLSIGGTSAVVSIIILITVKRANAKAAWENAASSNSSNKNENKRPSNVSAAEQQQQEIFTISGNSARD